jgi:hypothetical protein
MSKFLRNLRILRTITKFVAVERRKKIMPFFKNLFRGNNINEFHRSFIWQFLQIALIVWNIHIEIPSLFYILDHEPNSFESLLYILQNYVVSNDAG